MKKQLKALLLVVLLACYGLPSLAQSTQGTEFWVSSTLVCSPDKKTANPYIAISAEEATTITIQGIGSNPISITQPVAAGSWNEFGNTSKAYNTDVTQGPINVQMDASKWYPINLKDANQLSTLAGTTHDYGLHITSSNGKKISVYVILSSPFSMDASNILPIHALGAEYYTQDYWADERDGDFNDALGITTILATENNTTIRISPKGTTYNNQSTPFTITLNQGQVYYLATQKKSQLAGTHIASVDGKAIAVFCGDPLTNLPSGLAARDCLFEQSMPIEYWGTQFIATRSLEKDGNLIGITATQNGTEIKIDGFTQSLINEGDTYYIMLQGPANPSGRDSGDRNPDLLITADVAYIETSCPCAVYNYDTGNGYKGSSGSEIIVDKHGDPSSVWLSPIQQKINVITFGTCYTNDTKDHFLNVITETSTCQQTKLTALHGASQIDKTSLLNWIPVPGNPTYSYARTKIGDEQTQLYSVFRLENPKGCIATVYGNGKNESYAYSAGSAAVEQGVNVNGETFVNGYRSEKNFCFGDVINFDAKVGTDEITRVDWYFGDGTTEAYGPAQIQHTYSSPGWYDVTADLYGHQVCTNTDEIPLGQVSFSFLVYRPDTVVGTVQPTECISLDDYNARKEYWDEKILNGDIDTVQEGCNDVVLNFITYAAEKEEILSDLSGQDLVYGHNGKPFTSSQDVIDTIPGDKSPTGCPIYRKYHVEVITCLAMDVTNDAAAQHVCPGSTIDITYKKIKGNIDGDAIFRVPGYPDQAIILDDNITDGSFTLPVSDITKPGFYTGKLLVNDKYCYDDKDPQKHKVLEFPIDFTVYYPEDIFKFKFNNVLAVYKPGQGGNEGYEFTAYQWFRNGMPIEGATSSILYLGQGVTFESGDVVYVVLTDKDGMVLPSCAQIIEETKDFYPEPQNAPAYKQLIDRKIVIKKGEFIYNIYGQRVM